MSYNIEMKYSSDLASKYSNQREDFNETDNDFMSTVNSVGVSGKDILDLGCGDGRHARRLIEMGAKSVLGLDINEKMIEIAKEKTLPDQNIKYIVSNGSKIPLEDRALDIVVSNFVIHYFPNTLEIFAEISRVLKIGGYFVGTFNITDTTPGFEFLYNQPMPVKLGIGDKAIIVQNLIKQHKEIEVAISKTGFKILEEKELDHPNAVIDDSFECKDKIIKHAVLIKLLKI